MNKIWDLCTPQMFWLPFCNDNFFTSSWAKLFFRYFNVIISVVNIGNFCANFMIFWMTLMTKSPKSSQYFTRQTISNAMLLCILDINDIINTMVSAGDTVISFHTPVPCTVLHETFQFWGDFLDKLRTIVPKSSMRSYNSSGGRGYCW